MPVALIAGAATIGGAVISSNATRSAASTARSTANAQIDNSYRIHRENVELAEPFRQTGIAANAEAANLLGLNVPGRASPSPSPANTRQRGGGTRNSPRNQLAQPAQQPQQQGQQRPQGGNQSLNALRNSPGYQFRLNEGMNALETGAAARGGLLSGGHIRSGTRYAQDYASNEYNNRFNQLQALTSGGQAATNTMISSGNNSVASANNALAQSGAAQANAATQRGSIYSGTLGALGGIYAGRNQTYGS